MESSDALETLKRRILFLNLPNSNKSYNIFQRSGKPEDFTAARKYPNRYFDRTPVSRPQKREFTTSKSNKPKRNLRKKQTRSATHVQSATSSRSSAAIAPTLAADAARKPSVLTVEVGEGGSGLTLGQGQGRPCGWDHIIG